MLPFPPCQWLSGYVGRTTEGANRQEAPDQGPKGEQGSIEAPEAAAAAAAGGRLGEELAKAVAEKEHGTSTSTGNGAGAGAGAGAGTDTTNQIGSRADKGSREEEEGQVKKSTMPS